jgi:hypothetical protein
METLCPSVQSNGEAVSDQLTVGGILRLFLPVLLHLLKLSAHKLRVLWQLAACGTPALGANLFHCPHCQHRVCWSSDATDSGAISESPLSYIPGDRSSTSIPISTALLPAEH